MHQFVSAVSPSNISPPHRNQCTQYMHAHIVCMGSTKRPIAPVLPAIGSEKLTNVPRLLRMDICISSYQQLAAQILVLRTKPNVHSISKLAHTGCMGITKRRLAPVLPPIGSDKLTNIPRLLRMDICINSYQKLTP